MSGYGDDLTLMIAAAREAGELARKFYIDGAQAWDKNKNDPVTEADVAVDALLKERLQEAAPENGWLSEETEDDPIRLNKRRVWVVDPIDGTRAFIKRQPEFVISIGLVESGEPVAGVIYNPLTEEMFEAAKGMGARLNGVTLNHSDFDQLAGAKILVSQMELDQTPLQDLLGDVETTSINSIAFKLVLVAAGRFDALISLRSANDWDICAAVIIAQEANCTVSDLKGAPFNFNRQHTKHPTLLIAPPHLHAIMRDRLASLSAGLARPREVMPKC